MKTIENVLLYSLILLAIFVAITSSVIYLRSSSSLLGKEQGGVEVAERYASSELRQYLDSEVSGLEVLDCVQRFADKYIVKLDTFGKKCIGDVDNSVEARTSELEKYRKMYNGASINDYYVAGDWVYYAEMLYDDGSNTVIGIQFHLVDSSTTYTEIVWGDLKGFSCAEDFNNLMEKFEKLNGQQEAIHQQLQETCDEDYSNFYNQRFAYMYYYYSKAYMTYNVDLVQNKVYYRGASVLFTDDHFVRFKELLEFSLLNNGAPSKGYSKFKRQGSSFFTDDEIFVIGEVDEKLKGGITAEVNLQEYEDAIIGDMLYPKQTLSTEFKFSDYSTALAGFEKHFNGVGYAKLGNALACVRRATQKLNGSGVDVLPTGDVYDRKPNPEQINALKEARASLTGYMTKDDEINQLNPKTYYAKKYFKEFYEEYIRYLGDYNTLRKANVENLPESLRYYYFDKEWDYATRNNWASFEPGQPYYNTDDTYHLGFMYNLEKIIKGTQCIQRLTSGVRVQTSESLADFEQGYNANVLALMNKLTDVTALVGHATSDNDSADLLDTLVEEIDLQLERRVN